MTSNAIEFTNVSYAYPRPPGDPAPPRLALDRITLAVPDGQRLGVLGPNGGGKSTLLKLTLGLLEPLSGEVRVLGLAPKEAARRRLIGYVPQRSAAELKFPLTVRQVVEMGATLGLSPWKSLSRDQRATIDRALEAVGASDIASAHIGSLSGGQLQRVLIARALASAPRLLLLDEPTVGIDAVGQQQFASLLQHLHDDLRLTVMVVSHDIRAVAAGCDRVACLSRTLHFHAAPQGLTPAVLAEVFRHDVAAIFGDVHVDAHSAAACTDPAHHHQPAQVPVTIRVEKSAR
ncbi:MAG TPA: metal ABC transporter ATP-binding protein [Phycisphaerales bacterium]|nr:metal ABC transporter ATP-binding protein [Phycisphaerales bacterium]